MMNSDSRWGFDTAILDRRCMGHDEINQSTARPASMSVRKRARPRVKKRRWTDDRGMPPPLGAGFRTRSLAGSARRLARAASPSRARPSRREIDARVSRRASPRRTPSAARASAARGVLSPAADTLARHVRPDVGDSDGACAFPARRDVSDAFGERPRLAPPPASLPPVPLLRRASEGAADARGC